MRPISTDGFAAIAAPSNLGPAPQLQWLPVDELVIDPSYQREITGQGRKNTRYIAENFSWTYFTPVIVSPIEGGRYAIIDGQHRTTAAKLIGIKQVPCALVIADKVTQAAAFRAINAQTTKLHKGQIFHARVAAGDETALAAQRICEAAGVKVAKSPGGWARRRSSTIAVTAIEEWAERDAEALRLALICLRQSNQYAEPGKSYLRDALIRSLAEVLSDHPEWCADEVRLVAGFEAIELDVVWNAAHLANATITGTTVNDQLQACLLDEFEKLFGRRRAA